MNQLALRKMILVEIARVFGTDVLDDVELKLNDSIKDNLLVQLEKEELVASRVKEIPDIT